MNTDELAINWQNLARVQLQLKADLSRINVWCRPSD